MSNAFGIPAEKWQSLIAMLATVPAIEQVVLFGSRALGTQREGSDIDLCLKGAIDASEIPTVQLAYDELYLPWKLDLVIYDQIKEPALMEHIDRVGKTVYP
jgi:uncharacterized protein